MCVCVCVCVRAPACVRTRACVRLIERMHVCADLRECMFMWEGVSQPSPLGQSRAWQQQSTVIWCVPGPTKTTQPLITVGSQARL